MSWAFTAPGRCPAAKHSGEVYYTNVHDEETGEIQYTVSYLPASSDTGALHLSNNGSMMEVPITDLVWTGSHFECVVSVGNQVFDFTGDIDPSTGELTGHIQDRVNAENGGPIRGGRVE